MKKLFITSFALVAALSNAQLTIASDSNFGNNSIVDLGSNLSGFLSYHFSNNKIILQNFDVATPNSTDSRITMLGTDGSVDSSFGTAGSFTCPLAYGTSGMGDFIHNFGDSSMMMFSGKKILYNGTLISTYGTAGQTEIFPNEIYRKVLPNGNLLIRTTNSIYQLNPAGHTDSAFGVNGSMSCNSTLYSYSNAIFSSHEKFVALHADHSILEYDSNSSSLRKMNYNTGNFDVTFGVNGNAQYNTGPSSTVMKFSVMNDNSLVNYLFEDSNPSVKFLTKTLPTGLIDTSFGFNGRIDLPTTINGINLLYGQDFTMVDNHAVIPVFDDSYPRKLYLLSAGNADLNTVNGQILLDTGITTQMANPDDKIFVSVKDNFLYLMISPGIVKRYTVADAILAVNDIEKAVDVQFVNPFKDELNLFTKEEIKSVQIFDRSGRLLIESKNSKDILTSSLEKGVYIIKITTQNDKVLSRKGIKN